MELILHTFGNTAPSRIQPKQDANVYKWPLTALRKLAKKVGKFFLMEKSSNENRKNATTKHRKKFKLVRQQRL